MKKQTFPESQMQQSIIRWWGYKHKELGVSHPAFLFAIPNGGSRSAITGSILKAEGVRAGIPDLMLAVPNEICKGLFIELKTPKGKPSADQITIMNLLENEGYQVRLCRSVDEAIKVIEEYLK